MSNLKDYYAKLSATFNNRRKDISEKSESPTANDRLNLTKSWVNYCRQRYQHLSSQSLSNLSSLKNIATNEHKYPEEYKYKEISKNLGEAESYETLRQERWGFAVKCPYCFSHNINNKTTPSCDSRNNHYYDCLSCNQSFNDKTNTPFSINTLESIDDEQSDDNQGGEDGGQTSLRTWMLCWYLYCSSTSITNISIKLGLNTNIIKQMITELAKIFQESPPLKKFLNFSQWEKEYKQHFANKQNHLNYISRKERHYGDTTGIAVDTAELRRQQTRRRNPDKKY